jgi:type I restriction enzyme M protein
MEQSTIFPSEAFGYWKITVERPLRLRVDLSDPARARFRKTCKDANEEPLHHLVDRIAPALGPGPHLDFNAFLVAVEEDAERHTVKLTARRQRLLQTALAERDEAAQPVIRKVHKPGKAEPNPLYGHFSVGSENTLHQSPSSLLPCVVEYKPDPELRDTEQVPLLED